jgi:hypothetical protein
MSKKVLLFIPVSKGGLMPDPLPEEVPAKEIIEDVPLHKELPKVHVLTSNQDLDHDGLADTVEYMTVADYAGYIDKPVAVVYRMIRDNQIESIKIKNKLHIIMES